jgi:hypothetical protein
MAQKNATLIGAVAAGYVLGRTKKGRLALTAAAVVASRRLGGGPGALVAEGIRKLGEVPQVAELKEQLKGDLMDAGRQAVRAAVDRRLESFAGALSDRTRDLGTRQRPEGEAADEHEEPEEPEERAEHEEPEEPEQAERGKREPEEERRRRRRQPGGEREAPGRGRRAPTKQTSARKAPAAKTTGRKSVSARRAAEQKSPSSMGHRR